MSSKNNSIKQLGKLQETDFYLGFSAKTLNQEIRFKVQQKSEKSSSILAYSLNTSYH